MAALTQAHRFAIQASSFMDAQQTGSLLRMREESVTMVTTAAFVRNQ